MMCVGFVIVICVLVGLCVVCCVLCVVCCAMLFVTPCAFSLFIVGLVLGFLLVFFGGLAFLLCPCLCHLLFLFAIVVDCMPRLVLGFLCLFFLGLAFCLFVFVGFLLGLLSCHFWAFGV